MPETSPSRPHFLVNLLAFVIVLTCVIPRAQAETRKTLTPPLTARKTGPTYKVDVGINSEIFPVFANFAAFQSPRERRLGIISVTIVNSTDAPLKNRVAVQIQGWSEQEIQLVEMGAGDVRTLQFAPTFLPRFYQNREVVAATGVVTISDMGGRSVFNAIASVRLRAVEDMYWGADFKYAQFIASWVTPHDAHVAKILSRAKEYMPGRRLPGYEVWKSAQIQEQSVRAQARAIYRTLQQKGIYYVKSTSTFDRTANTGLSERVRMPSESMMQASANCIDGAVTYASLFENLGMDPMIVLVPGHAYVGVRVAEKSQRYLYIETSLRGRATFEAAVQAAEKGIARYRPEQITRIPVADARRAGIYPMPSFEVERHSTSSAAVHDQN